MGRSPEEAPSSFPKWVVLACLAFGTWQFFTNTLPAVREGQALRDLAGDLMTLRRQYDEAIQQTRLAVGENNRFDLQAVLVAIDQQGYTPAELCAAFPLVEPPAAAAPDGPVSGGRQ
ncbi:MAG: hypothetical protein JNN13_04145 [Planctomycetes bacterium]|nr:hypothetical protein [Planctomycetota bacterium]